MPGLTRIRNYSIYLYMNTIPGIAIACMFEFMRPLLLTLE